MTSALVISTDDLQKLIRESVSEILNTQLSRINPPEKSEELLKIKDVAKLLKVHTQTVYNWKKEGRLPFRQIGKRIYYEKSEVLSALDSLQYAK